MKIALCLLALVGACSAEKWQWPEAAASVRIDTKVKFLDHQHDHASRSGRVQSDEVPFMEAVETDGFYNRPPGSGRFPVRVEQYATGRKNYDGTLDSLQYCKCVSTPECQPHGDSLRACGSGKYLCCYKKPNRGNQQNSEYFNEINDERPMLYPGRENLARPFPPPPSVDDPEVLVGPGGPTGIIGPSKQNEVLVGPGGPTGIIGPANKNILTGPEGSRDIGQSESAQRGVLVGPSGPTGIIGPGGYGRRPVLVGPGGPTGIIGPRPGYFGNGYGRQAGPGVLVGPGGPTGIIGPGRQILVGPGGPTGRIGPQSYFGK